ncbi:hypothetical protein Tco_1185874 [Tanacetum coccineum]
MIDQEATQFMFVIQKEVKFRRIFGIGMLCWWNAYVKETSVLLQTIPNDHIFSDVRSRLLDSIHHQSGWIPRDILVSIEDLRQVGDFTDGPITDDPSLFLENPVKELIFR